MILGEPFGLVDATEQSLDDGVNVVGRRMASQDAQDQLARERLAQDLGDDVHLGNVLGR